MPPSQRPGVAHLSHPAAPRESLDGTRAIGRLLSTLLSQPGPYRRRWESRLDRTSDTALNKAAVAKVIAHHLWDTGERPDTDTELPRKIKDRVYRALSGDLISAETLRWFVAAFAMTADDRERLWALRLPGAPRPGGPVVNSLRHAQFVPLPQRHRTIAIFERRIIGPAGSAVAHRTTHAILACDDDLTGYPYRLDGDVRHLYVRRGGHVTTRHEFPGSSPVLEITFNVPLLRGQVASLEYDVEFEPRADPACEYRRVAHARCENADIVVQFDPARRPAELWWTIWDDYRGDGIVHQEPAAVDVEGCAHHFVPYLEHAAVGFRWTW